MKVKNHKNFAAFDYVSTTKNTRYKLGDIVTRNSPDGVEIGVIIQIHDVDGLRTDMFGNCDISEISLSTLKEVKQNRKTLIKHVAKRDKWADEMEFQYNPNNQWLFCSYSTFLKHKKIGLEVRNRKVGTGTWRYFY